MAQRTIIIRIRKSIRNKKTHTNTNNKRKNKHNKNNMKTVRKITKHNDTTHNNTHTTLIA